MNSNNNQEIIQPSETSFHIRSAKFLCRPCNRQFSSVNPENGRAACPRCESYSNLMIQDAQQSPIEASEPQAQPQQPRTAQFIRQTIYRPGQTIIIETISPQMQFGGGAQQQASQNIIGQGLGDLFGFGALSSLFGGLSQPSPQQPSNNNNPSDLFGNENQQPQQQQGFFGSPLNMFFMPAPMMFFNTNDYERVIQEFLRNDPNNHGPAPASEKSINELKEFEYCTGACKNTDCSVCQDEYNAGDKCVALPCGHNYHKDCVVEWLKRHDSCPVCRKSISSNNNQQQKGGREENSNRMEEEEEIPQQQQQAGF